MAALRVARRGLPAATDWIEEYRRFWEQQFDRLEAFLKRTAPEEAAKPAKPPGSGNAVAESLSNLILRMTRTFDASPDRVFAAWTDAEQFGQWFGPVGVKTVSCEIDARVGGAWGLVGEHNNTRMAVSGKYVEFSCPIAWSTPSPGTRRATSPCRAARKASLPSSSLRSASAPK